MTKTETQEIHSLANEITEQEALNIVAGWNRDNEMKSIEKHNALIRLGDSVRLACATVIIEKANSEGPSKMYEIAYKS